MERELGGDQQERQIRSTGWCMLHDVPTESLCIVKYDQPCQECCWEIPVNNWKKTSQYTNYVDVCHRLVLTVNRKKKLHCVTNIWSLLKLWLVTCILHLAKLCGNTDIHEYSCNPSWKYLRMIGLNASRDWIFPAKTGESLIFACWEKYIWRIINTITCIWSESIFIISSIWRENKLEQLFADIITLPELSFLRLYMEKTPKVLCHCWIS